MRTVISLCCGLLICITAAVVCGPSVVAGDEAGLIMGGCKCKNSGPVSCKLIASGCTGGQMTICNDTGLYWGTCDGEGSENCTGNSWCEDGAELGKEACTWEVRGPE